jgi:hypothetical protein
LISCSIFNTRQSIWICVTRFYLVTRDERNERNFWGGLVAQCTRKSFKK